MQSSSFNLLMGLGVPPSNAGGSAVASAGDEAAGGDLFAALLSDSGMEMGGDGLPEFTQAPFMQTAASALAAQEVAGTKGEIDLTAVNSMADRLIGTEEAKVIVERIDRLMQLGGEKLDSSLLTQVRASVQRIAGGGEPRTIAQVIQSLPVVAAGEGNPAHKGMLMALLTPRRMLDQGAATEEEEAPKQASAMWQSMQAAMFCADHGKVAPATPAARQEAKKTVNAHADISDITFIEPLSDTKAIGQNLPLMVDAQTPTQQEAAPTMGVAITEAGPALASINGIPVRSDLDDAIPPLSTGLVADVAELPDVELPHMQMSLLRAKGADKPAFKPEYGNDAPSGDAATIDRAAGTDSTAQPVSVGSASNTHATRTVNLMPTPGFINHAPVHEQVHVAIQQAAKDGLDRITIQLDPVELGRVEVQLQTSRDGVAQIHFMIDKAETFDSLSRDARALERALQEAGVKADTGSMQFNLRQPPQQHADANGQNQRQQAHPDEQGASEQQISVGAAGSHQASVVNHYTLDVREGVDISA